uniref:Interleukin-1 receptor-like 1 n=1 Tax=Myotis myotis TaxID=51298 RepID=A0A7J7RSE7_MYOMY|nr:interleukin 1 receptor like 1 [Myotis myotis]
MRLRVLAILTVLIHFTAASISRSFRGMENEALFVRCPREGSYQYPVEWYYSNTNRSVTTQKGNRVFAAGEYLKLLPAKVEDSGVYTCIVRSSTFVKTGHVNVTIYKKQPGCKIPNGLIYSKTFGSEKNSKIYCPTIKRYNWTAPVEWFKNCKVLQGSRYYIQEAYLLIDNATNEDTGDYTCKFMHNENGVNYNVTATRAFAFHRKYRDDESFSLFPEIIAPLQNETRDVEVGRAADITCSACFGKGSQILTVVVWQVNGTNVRNFSEARIWQEQEQNQSSSSALTCRSAVLRIAEVREEDLLQRYDCKAMNLHGWRRRSLRLRRKKPSKECFRGAGRAPAVPAAS